MTRPKVEPDKRQRTATACDSCKRRKQKCNGQSPCSTCSKRSLSCSYNPSEPGSSDEPSPSKKRRTDHDLSGDDEVAFHEEAFRGLPTPNQVSPRAKRKAPTQWNFSSDGTDPGGTPRGNLFEHDAESISIENAARSIIMFPPAPEAKPEAQLASGATPNSATDEEADNHTLTRMLEDPTGRLLYVGDSATLSFLQLIRMMVETTAGPSPFTADPRRHRIVENSLSVPLTTRLTHLLPDRQTARVLVDSFFINTHGLLQVFERKTFLHTLERCYSDPLSVDPAWLCLLNLVFAIGLILATPSLGSSEDIVISKLRRSGTDRSEIFYLNAKSHQDPIVGFEDAGFWSIQALLLMAVYMLTVSKRNTASAYFGMAVRSAFALGLHRQEETAVIFSPEEQEVRQNLWRSLYVMDRFISASLGRPIAISEDDCSGHALNPPETPSYPMPGVSGHINILGLEAAVRSCRAIGVILRKIYQKRKISAKLAQEIADQCKIWPKALSPTLHWRQASPSNPSQGIAILHVNLFYCHSIILLTRPFFLYLLNGEVQRTRVGAGPRPPRVPSRIEKFSEACVYASTHTIGLVQNAFEGRYLQRRNPFVIYFLFAAALVVLSNEFANLYYNAAAESSIENAITILSYCAESDSQAPRLLHILLALREVVTNKQRSQSLNPQHLAPPMPTTAHTPFPDISPRIPGSQRSPLGVVRTPPITDPIPLMAEPTPQHPPITTTFDPTQRIPPPPPTRHGSFSSMLDLSAANNPATVRSSDETSTADEHIDFDALWQWPAPTAVGTPNVWDVGVQGINDSTVPLFGMMEPGGS